MIQRGNTYQDSLNNIVRGTLVIIFFSILAKFVGFFRGMAIAASFGTTWEVDAYLVAYTVPYLLMAVVGASLATVVIPVFNEYVAAGKREEAWSVFSALFTLVALILGLAVAAGLFFPEGIVRLLAPGLPEGTSQVASQLTTVMLPALVLLGLYNLFSGFLNANNIFGPPSLYPAVTSVFIITAALGSHLWGIYGLAVGTLAGIAAGTFLQVPFLFRVGFHYRPSLNLRNPGVVKCFGLMLPVMIGAGLIQVYVIINRALGSGLPEGSIASLNYANTLVSLPFGLYANALRTSIFPTLSRQASEGRPDEMAQVLAGGCRMVIFLTLPLLAGFLLLRYPLVRFIYQWGAFDERAVHLTAAALFFYSFGMLAQCLNPMLIRGFYSLQNTRTPVYIGLFYVFLNLVFSLILIHPLQHGGLALAYSIAANCAMVAYLWLLSRQLKNFPYRALAGWSVSLVGVVLVMAVVVASLDTVLAARLPDSKLWLLIRLLLDGFLGAALYLTGAIRLRLPEPLYLFKLLREGLAKAGLGFLARRCGKI
jgi:putative peptidoglycan lipid II flippase